MPPGFPSVFLPDEMRAAVAARRAELAALRQRHVSVHDRIKLAVLEIAVTQDQRMFGGGGGGCGDPAPVSAAPADVLRAAAVAGGPPPAWPPRESPAMTRALAVVFEAAGTNALDPLVTRLFPGRPAGPLLTAVARAAARPARVKVPVGRAVVPDPEDAREPCPGCRQLRPLRKHYASPSSCPSLYLASSLLPFLPPEVPALEAPEDPAPAAPAPPVPTPAAPAPAVPAAAAPAAAVPVTGGKRARPEEGEETGTARLLRALGALEAELDAGRQVLVSQGADEGTRAGVPPAGEVKAGPQRPPMWDERWLCSEFGGSS